jgi:hypothetical protein
MVSRSSASRKVGARAARLRPGDAEALTRSLAALDGTAATSSWKRWWRRPKNCCARPISPFSLPKVAEEIGSATGVDRVHIFLVDGVGGDGQILQHRYLAC